jgi:hypothetical protein
MNSNMLQIGDHVLVYTSEKEEYGDSRGRNSTFSEHNDKEDAVKKTEKE